MKGVENDINQVKQSDIVYQDKNVTAFMALRKWPNNAGHVLVIPNAHFENIYTLPGDLSAMLQETAKTIALAMKQVYACGGILLLQRNEPAGEQRTWHYHLHVIPRYENDAFHSSQRLPFPAHERAIYAHRLRTSINQR